MSSRDIARKGKEAATGPIATPGPSTSRGRSNRSNRGRRPPSGDTSPRGTGDGARPRTQSSRGSYRQSSRQQSPTDPPLAQQLRNDQVRDLGSLLEKILDRMDELERRMPEEADTHARGQANGNQAGHRNQIRGPSETPTYSGRTDYSKKYADPTPLSDGVNPTFEGWRIQIRGKLQFNADHFANEEARMFYIFGRTTGDAQRHLEPRYKEDSPARFVSIEEMLTYLASIYVNPNRVRDAKFDYDRLMMKPTEAFSEFQTRFLHLAGEANITPSSLKTDLYDKLNTTLQRALVGNVRSWTDYQEMVADCLSADTELRRINLRETRQKRFQTNAPSLVSAPAAKVTTPTGPGLSSIPAQAPGLISLPRPVTANLQRTSEARQTPPPTGKPFSATCYNCGGKGHISPDCPHPKKGDLKEIEEAEEEIVLQEDLGNGEP